jgi:hypothetical protein
VHGQEHEAHAIEQGSSYRDEGESLLIVRGKLSTGPWLCDRCNATLTRGMIAYLFLPFTRHMTESMVNTTVTMSGSISP